MKQGKVLRKLIRKYRIKHGDLIDINTLKFIAGKESIEVNDLMTIFGISVGSRSRIRQNPFNKARINIFDSEGLKEIEVSVKDEVKEIEKITEKRLERFCYKYKINRCILNKMLKINKEQIYKLKKGQKYIILKPQNETKKTRITLKDTKLKMNYLKMDIKYEYGEGFYTSAELRKLCRKYKIPFDDFLKIQEGIKEARQKYQAEGKEALFFFTVEEEKDLKGIIILIVVSREKSENVEQFAMIYGAAVKRKYPTYDVIIWTNYTTAPEYLIDNCIYMKNVKEEADDYIEKMPELKNLELFLP